MTDQNPRLSPYQQMKLDRDLARAERAVRDAEFLALTPMQILARYQPPARVEKPKPAPVKYANKSERRAARAKRTKANGEDTFTVLLQATFRAKRKEQAEISFQMPDRVRGEACG